MSNPPLRAAPRARPVAGAPVEPLLERREELARRWLVELIVTRPLERARELELDDFARAAPALCGQILSALRSDDELERMRSLPAAGAGEQDGAPAMLARVVRAGDAHAAVEVLEALRGILWEALLEELRTPGAREVAELGDRLAYVCSSVLAPALDRVATGEPEADAVRSAPPADGPGAPPPPAAEALADAEPARGAAPASAAPGAAGRGGAPADGGTRAGGGTPADGGTPGGGGTPAGGIAPAAEGVLIDELEELPPAPASEAGGPQGRPWWGQDAPPLPPGGAETATRSPAGRRPPSPSPPSPPPSVPGAPPVPAGASIAIRDERGEEGPAAWIRLISHQLGRFASDQIPFAVLLVDLGDLERPDRDVPPGGAPGLADQVERSLERELDAAAATGGPAGSLTCERPGRYWLLATATDAAGARGLAETLVRAVRPLTASRWPRPEVTIGTAVCPDDGRDAATLAACADMGVYAARRAGRSIAAVDEPA